jgi:uncharacterized protein with HEPN domain
MTNSAKIRERRMLSSVTWKSSVRHQKISRLRFGNGAPISHGSKMASMRDRLIHHYFGINLDIVWGVIMEELPVVAQKIGDIQKDVSF